MLPHGVAMAAALLLGRRRQTRRRRASVSRALEREYLTPHTGRTPGDRASACGPNGVRRKPSHPWRALLWPSPQAQRETQRPLRPDPQPSGHTIDRLAFLARAHPGEPLKGRRKRLGKHRVITDERAPCPDEAGANGPFQECWPQTRWPAIASSRRHATPFEAPLPTPRNSQRCDHPATR